METISSKVEKMISVAKNAYTVSALKYFKNKLNQHRYGVDLGKLPYSSLSFEKVGNDWIWVIPVSKLPKNFEILATVTKTNGYQDLFAHSEGSLQAERIISNDYKQTTSEGKDITLEIVRMSAPEEVIIPAKEFNSIFEHFKFFFNSGENFEPQTTLSSSLLSDYKNLNFKRFISEKRKKNRLPDFLF